MAKRNKPKGKSAVPVESNAGTLSHNPLAALAAFRNAINSDLTSAIPSPGPQTKPDTPTPKAPPSAKPTLPRESPAKSSVVTKVSNAPAHELRFPGKIVVRRENKGRAGKTVTRISGLPAAELAVLAKEMKKALGCGATVEADDLVLLGSLVDRASAWLDKAGVGKLVKGN